MADPGQTAGRREAGAGQPMTSEVNDSESPDPVVGTSKPRLLDVLGPGLITGAVDDDPSGIATNSQAGAQFGFGIIGTGLLAIPVLAGSAAYALGEARKWPIGLARQPMEAKAFYATTALATLVGTVVDFSPIDPIKALYWSAVINGIVSCPVMVTMMLMTRRTDIMGTNTIGGPLQWIGWLATTVMTAAVAGMIWTSFL